MEAKKLEILKSAISNNGLVSEHDFPRSMRDSFKSLEREGIIENLGKTSGSETAPSYKITEEGKKHITSLVRQTV